MRHIAVTPDERSILGAAVMGALEWAFGPVKQPTATHPDIIPDNPADTGIIMVKTSKKQKNITIK